MNKAKKWILLLCSCVAVIVKIVILCCTLFAVKDIKLDFRTSTVFSYVENEIIEKSGIPKGKCVFFLKKNQYEKNIEKNFPYLKVINIETKIPSHLVVHLAEREEFYAILLNGKTYMCDDELKVLRIEEGENYISTEENAIKIDGASLNIKNDEITEGDFLKIEKEGLLNLYNSFLYNNRGRGEMLSFIKDIKMFDSLEQVTNARENSIMITTHAGRNIYLYNIDYGQKYKIQKMFSLLTSIMDVEKFSYSGIIYDKNQEGNDNEKMMQILSKSDIHIYNYIRREEFSEKDNYYILRYEGSDVKNA